MADDKGKLRQFEYRAKLAEAELGVIKGSKAYKASKILGRLKKDVTSDPVGLSRKAANILFREPKKLARLLNSAKNRETIQQSIAEQTGKYQEWILLNEPDIDELQEQRKASLKFTYQPLISIITPVFNPPIDVFEELIETVLNQTYPNFELCLGNFTDNEEVIKLLKKYEQLDQRVKYQQFDHNKGIAGNSNQILEKATGEYIALLDHDDTLSPDALYENVKLLNEKKYDFIYSDKDKIDEQGNRFDPLFKPQLSPEMLLNVNYLTHLNVMRTELVRQVGAWDSDTDGAQDWDLFLKVVNKAKYVGHIPKVLYHWRVIASSTAMSIDTKPYALEGQKKAVNKQLAAVGVKGESVLKHTELFIDWGEVEERAVTVFIQLTSVSNTRNIARQIKRVLPDAKFVAILDDAGVKSVVEKQLDMPVVTVSSQKTLNSSVMDHASMSGASLFIIDNAQLPKGNWWNRLAGWLNVPGVAAASGRLVNAANLIMDSGGVISPAGTYQPLFQGFPRYYQSYIGNAEWVRDLSVLSGNFFVAKNTDIQKFIEGLNKEASFDDYFLWLTFECKQRLVLTPHVTALVPNIAIDNVRQLDINKDQSDIYRNPNVSNEDPLRLFDDEPLEGIDISNTGPVDRYQSDAVILARSYDLTAEQLKLNKDITTSFQGIKNPRSVCWVLPSFDAVYAGLMNIFTFAEYLSVEHGLDTTFYILKAGDNAQSEKTLVVEKIPALRSAKFMAINEQYDIEDKYDIAIATLWSTAYVVAKAENVKRKCYFIQDNETNFYPKGSVSALVEMSYRLGLYAIANTEGLLDMYRSKYGGEGTVVTSKVDLSSYHPSDDPYRVPKKPYKVFFYARPNMPRNAFELGIAALSKLKADLGKNLEVITAGAEWDPSVYGVSGQFTNLGKIKYEAVPKLYRSVDAGLMFMFSGHPGVTASELMASGTPVVVNEYDDKTWNELYVDGETCLVSLPLASEVARNLKRCLLEEDLRKKLIDGGLKKTKKFYSGYNESLEPAFREIIGG